MGAPPDPVWLEALWPAAASTALKVAVLLAAAGSLVLLLRRAAARARSLVWAAACVGALLLPAASVLLPPVSIDLPTLGSRLPPTPAEALPEATRTGPTRAIPWTLAAVADEPVHPTGAAPGPLRPARASVSSLPPYGPPALLVLWVGGSMVGLGRCVLGLGRIRVLSARALPADGSWRAAAAVAAQRLGLRHPPEIRISSEVSSPVTWGSWRPLVLVPESATLWCPARRQVVLLHELIHVQRHDWLARLVAQLVTAMHWFNPLAWIAARRLVHEQERACDDEVLALGERPSRYASHLLAVARALTAGPAATVVAAGPGLARRPHMEERIMAILNPHLGRRIGLAVTLTLTLAVLGLVPALAAIRTATATTSQQPTVRTSRSAELSQVVAELNALEDSLEPALAPARAIETEMAPQLERLRSLEVDVQPFHEQMEAVEHGMAPLHEQLEKLQRELEPHLARLEEVEADLAPSHAAIREIGERMRPHLARLEDLEGLRVADLPRIAEEVQAAVAPLHEELEVIQTAMAPLLEDLQAVHADVTPIHAEIEAVQRELAPHLARLADLGSEMEPLHRQLQDVELDMEPMHRRLEDMDRALEPLLQDVEALQRRLDAALATELESILTAELGPVTAQPDRLRDVARHLLDQASTHVRVEDDRVRLQLDVERTRAILEDKLDPAAGVTEAELAKALDRAASLLSEVEIQIRDGR